MNKTEQTYADKSTYNGQWSAEGVRQGCGRLNYANGVQYTGEFVNGFQEGHGVMIIPDKNQSHRYEGQFKQGSFDGFGIFTRSDGMQYHGLFKQGSLAGLGLVTLADGSNGIPRQEGQFEDGKLIHYETCSSQVEQAKNAAKQAQQFL